MNTFTKKLTQLGKAYSKVAALEKELSLQISEHLGDGWFITYAAGDGLLLGSPDASNYDILTYVDCIGMPRGKAIAYIESRPFN